MTEELDPYVKAYVLYGVIGTTEFRAGVLDLAGARKAASILLEGRVVKRCIIRRRSNLEGIPDYRDDVTR